MKNPHPVYTGMADGRTCCSSLLQELNGIELEELTDLREEEDEDVEHRKSQHSRRDDRLLLLVL